MMIVTNLNLIWCSEKVPEDAAGVEKLLEASGVWKLVRYACSADHPVTVVTVMEDVLGVVVGELDISFRPCNKGYIESDVRGCITSRVVRALPGKTWRNKRVIGEGESGGIVSRRGRCLISSKRVLR
jgi:hypothetical protein